MKQQTKKITVKYVTEVKFKLSEDKFKKILDQHEKAFIVTLKEIQAFREEAREYRQTMSSLMHTDIRQERSVEDLHNRVERLETRVK